MITRTINILGWEAVFLFSSGRPDPEEVIGQLVGCDPPDSVILRVRSMLEGNRPDEGFTFSNPDMRRSLVYIGPTSSGREFLSSFCHELAHFVCDLCLEDGISLRGERVAYIQGETARRLSDVVCLFSCDHCRDAY